MSSCIVCLDDYKGKKIVKVNCQYCPAHACRGCTQRYLLQSYEDPHCMDCKRGWASEFMAANFPLSFRNDTLRKHRRKVLFEREKTVLPALQIYVEYKKDYERLNAEYTVLRATFGNDIDPSPENRTKPAFRWRTLNIDVARLDRMIIARRGEINLLKTELSDRPEADRPSIFQRLSIARKDRDTLKLRREAALKEVGELRPLYNETIHKLNDLTRGIREASHAYQDLAGAPRERREFIMRCPAENCRGFLSTAYKCGTCDSWACKDCAVCLGKDNEVEHTCNPEMVESAKAIRSETRPCPKCGTRIFKIDGCFAKDTPILMWNGQTKLSQDIVIGDELVGDDGEKRVVETTCSGEDEMYEVSQKRGMSYTVNSKHKLALKPYNCVTWRSDPKAWVARWFNEESRSMMTKKFHVEDDIDMKKKEAEAFLEGMNLSEVVEITVDDYMKLATETKHNLYGYRSEEINWSKKEVSVDPYLMGLWLGDGVNNGMVMACNPEKDPEIVQYLLNWCDANGCELVHDDAYAFRLRRAGLTQGRTAMNHGATSADCKGCNKKKCDFCDLPSLPTIRSETMPSKNAFREGFERYNLLQNKHIPQDYIVNDRETRLQLLAGLIDTDGHVASDGKRIQIAQANHSIAKQIALVARSLGFVVSINLIKKSNVSFPGAERKDYPPHLGLSISGTNISEIPTRIKRKECHDSTPNKDWFKSSIEVKPVGKGTYYGWSISGNKRFVGEDMTVLRNCDQMFCVMEGCGTAFSWNTGHIVTGVIHNPHYYEWLRRNGGDAPAREVGDIPCGGMPATWRFVRCMHGLSIPNDIKTILMETFRNMQELVADRIGNYPARMPQLMNKDDDVAYLMNRLNEEEWKRQLEISEARFNRKKEIGQILQTLITAGSDMMNRLYEKASNLDDTEAEIYMDVFVGWLLDTCIPEFEQLRNFGNESLRALGKRDRMAVPQLEELWKWKGGRALYKTKVLKGEVLEALSGAPSGAISGATSGAPSRELSEATEIITDV